MINIARKDKPCVQVNFMKKKGKTKIFKSTR